MNHAKDVSGQFRKASANHLDGIKKMVYTIDAFTRYEKADLFSSIQYYIQNPEKDEFLTYIYLVGGEVAGFISFGKGLGEKTFEIYWIGVSPKYRGMCVGSRLLKQVEKKLAKNKARIVFVETESSNPYTAARRFYQKMGYRPASIVKDYFSDGNNKIIYSKRFLEN